MWFRFPEGERQLRYPFITIDLLTVEPAFDLFHATTWIGWTRAERAAHPAVPPCFSPGLPAADVRGQRELGDLELPPVPPDLPGVDLRTLQPARPLPHVDLHDRRVPGAALLHRNPVDDTWRRTENLGMAQRQHPSRRRSRARSGSSASSGRSRCCTEIPQNHFSDPSV